MTPATTQGLPEPSRIALLEAARAQTTLLLRSRRPGFLLLGVGIVIIVAILYHTSTLDGWTPAVVVTPGWYDTLFLLGGVWGVLIWHEEGPKARWYHWSLPLDASVHDSARVLAGAVWLLAAVALFLVWVVGMSAATGHLPELLAVPTLTWAAFPTTALVGYLLLAALGTLTGKALEWGLLSGVTLLVATFELAVENPDLPAVLRPVRGVLRAVFLSDHGFLTVLHGMARRAQLEAAGGPVAAAGPSADPGTWLAATGLWLALGAGAVLGAAWWHRRR